MPPSPHLCIRLLTRRGPVPPAHARWLWADWDTSATTRVGGLVPSGPGHGGHPGCSRCAGSPESYRRCRPGLGRLGSRSGAHCRARAAVCGSPGASSLWRRRARSAHPETSRRHPGHPPVHWIAGTYRHRGPRASRRVPYGGAGRQWLPDVPSVSEPPAIHARQQRPGASPPGPWSGQVGSASGPGPVSTAARPQIGGPGLHTPGPGPLPLFGRQGYSPGLGPSQPVRRREHRRAYARTQGLAPGPGPDRPPLPVKTRTKPPSPSVTLSNMKSGVTGDVVTLRFMLHEHGDSRLPAAQPGFVPPLQTLLVGVNHVGSASNFSTLLADSILSGPPFLSALFAAFLANTPDPTHFFLLSTLTLPGQAYVLLLAFSVRTRRASPSPLRSGP
jgi:hypothetical protein